jgi:NAD(P)H-nitrite reductase large subunit
MAKGLTAKYLIIGNSAGGIAAAEAIREVDSAGSVTIVTDEPYPAYSRPLISKYLSKEREVEGMLFRPADFYSTNSISLLADNKAVQLDLDKHEVELGSGERISWQRLLIASGGTPIIPEISGLDKRGVFSFTTLDDAKAIDEFLTDGSSAVVIGGGLIGISVTEALVKRGVSVSVVEMKDRILNTILDETGSAIATEAVKKAGVRIMSNQTVAEIKGGNLVSGVTLDNGESIPCSLVVVAIGVVPRVDLVQGTGIDVNRGIVVDRTMATSHPDVYACGDAVEAYDFTLDTNRAIPIWPSAYIGGRVAGFNMAGVHKEYAGGTALNSLTYFGVDIVSAGIVVPPADGYEALSTANEGTYKKLLLRGNVIVGMICIGDIDKAGILYSLMREKTEVDEFKHKLLDDDFGLISLPQALWQERLGEPPLVGVVASALPPEEEVEDYSGE